MKRLLFTALIAMHLMHEVAAADTEKTLTYAVPHWPPWTDTQTYPYQGIDVEIITALADKVGFKINTLKCAWKRCLRLLEQGEADIATNVLKKADREVYLHYLTPAYRTNLNYVIYTHKGDMRAITTKQQLYPLQITIERGAHFPDEFSQDKNIQTRPVSQTLFAIKQLINQRANAVVGEEYQLDYLVSRLDTNRVLEKQPLLFSEPINAYIVLSKKSHHAEAVAQLSDTIAQMMDSGQIESMMRDYLRPNE
ncbi:transporter substrate-binding domain-containing protein [Salinivibrio sp. IB574]|uniref:substrate-binding periplasmic protein n=1 Tax=Salinivibrio sp. IB574 TaxID=1909444 RepID=UPI0012FFA0BA|nr:transporter substrate-binding domain-containing protein [Salinivibrio sp. IB574]